MKLYILAGLQFFILLSGPGCYSKAKNSLDSEDILIARVGNRMLYQKQIRDLVSEGTSATDSVTIVNGFIQNWIREGLMILEAEKKIAADINIDQLVEDYRSSLLVYNFEKKLIDEQLDTIVLNSEKTDFYEMHRNNYQLSHPIFKCIAGQFDKKNKSLRNIVRTYESGDLYDIQLITEDNAVKFHIDTSVYLTKDDLQSWMPQDFFKNKLNSKKAIRYSDKDYEYIVKMVEFYDENTIPPFNFLEGRITKTILSERKNALLKEFRQQLYVKGIAEKKFEIYNIE
jgi:hypothetical protein